MVTYLRLGVVTTLLLFGNISYAKTTCTTATEYQPELCRVKLPQIVSVDIEENGTTSKADNEKSNCSKFKLTVIGVRRYFSRALKLKNAEDAQHTLDWLPCYASGTMRFVDNRKIHWTIYQSQTGKLVMDNEKEVFFYCPDCKFEPFLY